MIREIKYGGRTFRLNVEERVGDAWLPASQQDMTDDLLRRLLWSMPIPRGVNMTFDLAEDRPERR